MAASPQQTRLLSLLRRHPTLSAAQIADALGVSQPTVSRLIRATPDVIAIGRARATRYALARVIGEHGRQASQWPLYRLDAQARPQRLGVLQALHGGGFHLQPEQPLPALMQGEFRDGLYPDLPWFLDDQRPQGFLGRAFARRVAAEIGAPPDLAQWQSDDILAALLRHGHDMPGDLIVGDEALQAAMRALLEPADVLDAGQALPAYARLAEQALRGEPVGSSAGGEQPKFGAVLRHADGRVQRLIVKFSERTHSPAGRRWADLLHCEQRAGQVLLQHGLPAARSHVTHTDGRVFLQSERFDRTEHGGRHGFVSLAALDAAFYGHGRIDWWRLAMELRRDGWMAAEDARRLAVIAWFGDLIGNTDMHLGNAGLILTDQRPLALAPVYDMLPMLWRPSTQGELVERELNIALPTPDQHAPWREAARLADDYWQQLAADAALSNDFRRIAEHAGDQVRRALRKFG